MRVNVCNRGKAQRPISTLQTSHKQVTLLFCKRACSYSQAAPVRCWRLRLLRPTHQSNMITLRSGRPLWTLTLVRTNSFFSFFFAPSLTQKMFTWRNKKEVEKKKYTARRLRPRDLRVKHKQQTVKHVCCESVRVMKSLAALAARKSHSAHADVLALHVLPRRHRAPFIFTCRHASRCPHLHTVQTLASLTSSCSSPGSCESYYQTSKTNGLDCVGLFVFFCYLETSSLQSAETEVKALCFQFYTFCPSLGKKTPRVLNWGGLFFCCFFFDDYNVCSLSTRRFLFSELCWKHICLLKDLTVGKEEHDAWSSSIGGNTNKMWKTTPFKNTACRLGVPVVTEKCQQPHVDVCTKND